jgi:hypothetical protein
MRSNRMAVPLALLVLASCQGNSNNAGSAAPAYAVLTERATANIPLLVGSNLLHLTPDKISDSTRISYSTESGLLTLREGVYRISGYSISSFGYLLSPEQEAAAYSAPGYAYLCNVETGGLQTLGTIQDPLNATMSSVDDVIAVADSMVLYLGHQNGDKVDGIFLGTFEEGLGTDHIFARLVVERTGDAPANTTTPAPAGTHACWPVA